MLETSIPVRTANPIAPSASLPSVLRSTGWTDTRWSTTRWARTPARPSASSRNPRLAGQDQSQTGSAVAGAPQRQLEEPPRLQVGAGRLLQHHQVAHVAAHELLVHGPEGIGRVGNHEHPRAEREIGAVDLHRGRPQQPQVLERQPQADLRGWSSVPSVANFNIRRPRRRLSLGAGNDSSRPPIPDPDPRRAGPPVPRSHPDPRRAGPPVPRSPPRPSPRGTSSPPSHPDPRRTEPTHPRSHPDPRPAAAPPRSPPRPSPRGTSSPPIPTPTLAARTSSPPIPTSEPVLAGLPNFDWPVGRFGE